MADKKNILLVDDEKEVIYAIEKFFTHKGYKTSVVFNGEEALSKLKEDPDLVVLDIKMPNVNGIDVLKEIRKNHKDTKTVTLTGFTDDYKDEAIKKRKKRIFKKTKYSL